MEEEWLKNYSLLNYSILDSTNAEGFRIIRNHIKGNFVIIAREQTHGRGSQGKLWESLSGNLHMSIIIRPDVNTSRLKELPFFLAIVIQKTIKEFIKQKSFTKKPDIRLKWPNDVLINGKKVSGILIESIRIDSINSVVIGIGINTHCVPNIQNVEVTSLLNEGIILKNPDCFLNSFMKKFHTSYLKWTTDDNFHDIRREWLRLAYNLNSTITINNGVSKTSGIFRGIDQDGNIFIELANKNIESFSFGRLTFLR